MKKPIKDLLVMRTNGDKNGVIMAYAQVAQIIVVANVVKTYVVITHI